MLVLFKLKCVNYAEGTIPVSTAKLEVLLRRHLLNKLIMCQTSRGNKITHILIPTILAGETTRICHGTTLKIHWSHLQGSNHKRRSQIWKMLLPNLQQICLNSWPKQRQLFRIKLHQSGTSKYKWVRLQTCYPADHKALCRATQRQIQRNKWMQLCFEMVDKLKICQKK